MSKDAKKFALALTSVIVFVVGLALACAAAQAVSMILAVGIFAVGMVGFVWVAAAFLSSGSKEAE